ncbi:GntR family transcriptional regulator [Microvirga puerhi]|uniref:GntR family transcriptional regulator n=1 Tax=Microvirga puerhi TaxID=2876078 RepID=A0ABS7VW63_9HYPH|nr:GntR family transcriptional regulator [Microvirga puerhi]MBZ6079152.1 GntR family transcriptional regulator [Microvirga puerhi]
MSRLRDVREALSQRVYAMAPHEMLPRERDLAEELGVSRTSLRQWLRELTEAGLIYSVRGKGTFVSDRRISKGTGLTSFTEDMVERGMHPATTVLNVRQALAEGSIAEEFSLAPGSLLHCIDRLRTADGAPMCIEQVHLPAEYFPGLLREDLSGSLYDIMRRQYGVEVVFARQHVRAVAPTAAQARLLQVSRNAPLLEVCRIGFDPRHRAIERAVTTYRGDRYDFFMTIRRDATPRE